MTTRPFEPSARPLDDAPREGGAHRAGAWWRKLAYLGAAYGPDAFVRHSPPLIGLAFAATMPAMRARVLGNLRRALGPRSALEERLDVLATFANFASCLAEGLAIGSAHPRPIERELEGREHLEAALARRRGVVLVTAHTGAWETAGPLLRRDWGLDVVVAMAKEPDDRARAVSDAARTRAGVKVAHVGSDPLAVLPLFTHLRRRGVVAFQLDRLPSAMRGIEVELFGERTAVPVGPFVLAAATGAPIVPAFTRRTGFFRYEIRLCPPLVLSRGEGGDEIARVAQRAAFEMERFIRANPTHWFHFHGDEPAAAPLDDAERLDGWCSSSTSGSSDESSEGATLHPAGKAVGAPPPGLGPQTPNESAGGG